MARVTAFRVNSKAIEAGEWQSPGEEYDDLEIFTRGFTDAYYDAQTKKTRRAALAYGNDERQVPSATLREIRVECLIAHVILDVRHLADENGQPVNFDGFCGLLRNPDYAELVVAVVKAASLVGRRKNVEAEEAAGN